MAIIPTVRCSRMVTTISFDTNVLDFIPADGTPDTSDPSFNALARDGALLRLSSHPGDGQFGRAIVNAVDEVDALFRGFRSRGLTTPATPNPPYTSVRSVNAGVRGSFMSTIPTGTRCTSRNGTRWRSFATRGSMADHRPIN